MLTISDLTSRVITSMDKKRNAEIRAKVVAVEDAPA
jgi:hypothetical protein